MRILQNVDNSVPAYEKVIESAARFNMDYFVLDSDHMCMALHPAELARILLREGD